MLSQALFDEDRLSNVKLNLTVVAWNVDRLVELASSSTLASRLSTHHRVLHAASHGSRLCVLLLRRILVLLCGPHLIRILVVLLLLILLLLVRVVVLLVRIVVLLLLRLLLLAVRILRLVVVLLLIVVPAAKKQAKGHVSLSH